MQFVEIFGLKYRVEIGDTKSNLGWQYSFWKDTGDAYIFDGCIFAKTLRQAIKKFKEAELENFETKTNDPDYDNECFY